MGEEEYRADWQEGWSEAEIEALIAADWERSYRRAYRLLVFETERPLTREETAFLVTNGFLSVVNVPNPPAAHVFLDLRMLAFQAFDAGRLWPYDTHVRALKRWCRQPYCMLDAGNMGRPFYARFDGHGAEAAE